MTLIALSRSQYHLLYVRGEGSCKSWGGLKDLSIIEVITCKTAWVACEAHFSWVWGHPLRKIFKNSYRCCEIKSGANFMRIVKLLSQKSLMLHDPLKCIFHARYNCQLHDQVVTSQQMIVGGAQVIMRSRTLHSDQWSTWLQKGFCNIHNPGLAFR